MPGEHLVEHHSQRIDVGTRIRRNALDSLRRNVLDGADHIARASQSGLSQYPRDTEVGHLRHAGVGHNDIRGFDIAMQHS